MASIEVSKPPKRLSPKGSFKLSLPTLLLSCAQCKAAASSPPESPTGAASRWLSSASGSPTSRGSHRQAELRQIFRHFDRDMDGKISSRELREFFASMGVDDGRAEDEDAEAAVAELGTGGDSMLGFEDFVRIVESKGGEEEEREDMRRAFAAFEAVKGSGRITARGLQRVLSQLGDDQTVADCQAMIRAYDVDGDGELDFHDFRRMMSQD